MKLRLIALALVFLVALIVGQPQAGHAYGAKGGDKTLSPYFVIEKGDEATDRFPLKETRVAGTINGIIADVYVTQKYANDGTMPINARYVFPASTRASVHGMKMTIGNQVVTARIKEREEAKSEFNKAKSEGKTASLLEQQRPNVFTMNIANIMPKDQVIIELHYSELLVPVEGTYEFVYPTVVGPRYSNKPEGSAAETDQWIKSPYLKEGKTPPTTFAMKVSLSTGIPIHELVSPSHKIDLSWKDKSTATVSLAESTDFGGNRDFIVKYRLTGREIQSGLLLYEGEKENFFLVTMQPPERITLADIPPREYIFILDASGSMHGFPLDTAKTLIKDLIGSLRESDTFNVILFSGSSSTLATASIPATKENIATALKLIESQRGGGGTELTPALKQALSLPRGKGIARTVIVITDGFIGAESEAFRLIRENISTTNLFSFGIGSSVNRHLIEGMARAGEGEPFVVTKPDEAPGAAEGFRRYVQSPLLTNIRVACNGFDAYDVEPQALPDLFAQRPLVLMGKWRGKPVGEIQVSGKTTNGTYSKTFRVAEAKPLPTNGALKYLWARTRAARLSDANCESTDSADTKKEITQLGLTYSLLTPYTSFVVVLETIRNPQKQAKDIDQPLPLPLGVSNLAVGGCNAVPEPEMWLLIACVPLALLFAGRRRWLWVFRKVLQRGTNQ